MIKTMTTRQSTEALLVKQLAKNTILTEAEIKLALMELKQFGLIKILPEGIALRKAV